MKEGLLSFRSVAYAYIRTTDFLVPPQVMLCMVTLQMTGLLEVKCPYKVYTLHKAVREACDESQFCCTLIDGQPHLKTTQAHYKSRARWQSQVCIGVTL